MCQTPNPLHHTSPSRTRCTPLLPLLSEVPLVSTVGDTSRLELGAHSWGALQSVSPMDGLTHLKMKQAVDVHVNAEGTYSMARGLSDHILGRFVTAWNQTSQYLLHRFLHALDLDHDCDDKGSQAHSIQSIIDSYGSPHLDLEDDDTASDLLHTTDYLRRISSAFVQIQRVRTLSLRQPSTPAPSMLIQRFQALPLRPVADSYELQTGLDVHVDDVAKTHLSLSWIASPTLSFLPLTVKSKAFPRLEVEGILYSKRVRWCGPSQKEEESRYVV